MNIAAVRFALLLDSFATAVLAWVQYVTIRACVVVAFLTIFPVLLFVELGLMALELSGWSVGARDCVMIT